jgi:PBSX family phage terminase large subunit
MKIFLSKLVGRGYRGFWETKRRYRVVKGGRASKKSCTTALWYVYMMMWFYSKFKLKPCLLVVRRYYNTHPNSTRAQLIWAIKRLGVEHLWEIHKHGPLVYKPSGQVILFRGMDDPDSITSITVDEGQLVWCWIEEAYQIHNEADFDKLDMSFRGDVPYPLFKQLTLTLNPWSDTTWIKPRFFDKEDDDTFTITTTYLLNEFLGDDDRAIFEKMRVNNPRRYAIEGLGEWGNSVGQIYMGYLENPEKNHTELPESEKPVLITCGLDYGSGTPDSKLGKTTLAAVALTQGFEKAYCIAESYYNDFFLPERIKKWVIDFLVALKEKYKVDIILHAEWASSDALNNAIIYELREKGITGISVVNAYKSTILDRIDLCQILLGEKRLLFTENVPCIKKAFSTALWDTEKQKLKGVPVRLDNGTTDIDILDCVEYALTKYANYLLAYQPKEPKTYKHGLQVIGG